MSRDPIEALGEISGGELIHAWPVCAKPQAWWIQVHSPALALRLERRGDCRRVAYSVAGEYLRTYEILRPKAFVERLVDQILRETGTNEADKTLPSPRTGENQPGTPLPRSAPPVRYRSFKGALSGVLA